MNGYIVMLGAFAGLGMTILQRIPSNMGNPNAAATGAILSGAITQSLFGDFLGRRRYMQLLCMVVTVGTIIQTSAQNYAMFLVGRILTGVAVGGLVGTVPIYNSEIAFACGYAPTTTSFQWRFPLALQIPPGIILFFGLQFFLPESPRWLINSGRDDEARMAFTQIRGDLSGAELHKEFDDMREQILFEKSTEVKTFAEAWSKYKKRILISVAVQSMTSLTGVNVVGYYQTTLYRNLGITGQTVLLLAGIYGTVGLIMNVFSIYFLDRFGRVKLLRWGTSALCVDLLYSALMTRYFAGSDNSVGKGLAVLGIYLFTAIYYLGLNSTTWLYGVEVLPVFLRSKVMGLASTSHFVWNVALTEAGPSVYVFVATTFVAAVGIFVYFPETKGKTLEEIAASFGDDLVHSEGTSVGKVQDERLEAV
ncbi:general substrate transporter [Armillaria borealis]|uniref:General substrate transporter n=1 Tax=Armillaria borealis TaxID=47425 RepID=A0AA39MG46_9AGAR|nr:general substrate transporter [Armillaria borealis]